MYELIATNSCLIDVDTSTLLNWRWLFFLLFPILNSYVDFRITRAAKDGVSRVNHEVEFIIRASIIAGVSLLSPNPIQHFIIGGLFFWTLFELSLNLMRGKNLFYVGETAKSDIWLKKVFPKNPGVIMFALKTIAIVGAVILF